MDSTGMRARGGGGRGIANRRRAADQYGAQTTATTPLRAAGRAWKTSGTPLRMNGILRVEWESPWRGDTEVFLKTTKKKY